MRDVIFIIGGVYHYKNGEKTEYIDVAAHKFLSNFIDGIDNSCKVIVINDVRRKSYPLGKKLFQGYAKDKIDDITYYDMPYINLPGIKYVTKCISYLCIGGVLLLKFSDRIRDAFVYSMHTPYLLLCPIIGSKEIRTTMIVPDLPLFMDTRLYEKKVKSFLKTLDFSLQKKLIKKVKNYILISKYMKAELEIKSQNCLIVEGLVKEQESYAINKYFKKYPKKENVKVVTYTGALNERYGIPMLINIFSKITDVELWLFGIGDYVEKITEAAIEYPNIKYYGSKNNEEIMYVQSISDLLVNPRSADEEYTKYSFPSKTIEYMLSGTPILCEKLLGIPDDYDVFLNYVDEPVSERKWLDKIIYLLQDGYVDAKEKALVAKKYILHEKNNKVQVKKIMEFLDAQG